MQAVRYLEKYAALGLPARPPTRFRRRCRTATPKKWSSIQADGEDLSFVTVQIQDKDGNPCPAADNLVKFSVTGAGSIRAVDNGNAATEEPFQADHRKAFSGLAPLIVSSKQGEAGRIHVVATSDGLTQATTDITGRR